MRSKLKTFIIKLWIRIPYITINYDRWNEVFVIGFGLYQLGVGKTFWSSSFKHFFEQTKLGEKLGIRYIFVEQHDNGDWWFHPRTGYYRLRIGAERGFKRHFWFDKDRPHRVLKVTNKFPAKHQYRYNSWYSQDLITFTQDKTERKHDIR